MILTLNSKELKKALETLSTDTIVSASLNLPSDYDISDIMIERMKSEEWTPAVEPIMIALDTDEDKRVRAELINDLIITEPLTGKKILDYGCGNGFLSAVTAKTAALSVGFDIVSDPDWSKHTGAILTTERADVTKNAPYDIIVLYDVLDHVMDDSQVKILQYLSGICRGKIIMRCHPWCSKNGTHMYKSFNKAFAQFFLSDAAAITKYGYSQLPTVKILHPRYQYNKWIREAGLQVTHQDVFSEPLDQYFLQPEQSGVLLDLYGDSMGGKFPTESLSSQFWDFNLVRK